MRPSRFIRLVSNEREQNLVCLTCRKITPQLVSGGEFTENRQVICRNCATRRIGRFDA